MNTNSKAMLALLQDARTVGARFKNSQKLYTYKCCEEHAEIISKLQEAKKNVYALVKNSSDLAAFEFSIVQIIELHDECQIDIDAEYEYSWIVDVVDTKKYEELQASDFECLAVMRKADVNARKKAILEALPESEELKQLVAMKRL